MILNDEKHRSKILSLFDINMTYNIDIYLRKQPKPIIESEVYNLFQFIVQITSNISTRFSLIKLKHRKSVEKVSRFNRTKLSLFSKFFKIFYYSESTQRSLVAIQSTNDVLF